MIHYGVVALPEYWTQLAVGLTLAGIGVLSWGFKPRIGRWIKQRRALERVIAKREGYDQFYGSEVGTIIDGVHHYASRYDLPPLKRILAYAKEDVSFLALSFEIMIAEYLSLIEDTIRRGVVVTVILLNPNSKYISNLEAGIVAPNLKRRIQTHLDTLCEEKEILPQGKLIIKTYDPDRSPVHSIIVLDSKSDDRWIKVEDFKYGQAAKERPSKAAFKSENKDFFQKSYAEYKEFLDIAVEYPCS